MRIQEVQKTVPGLGRNFSVLLEGASKVTREPKDSALMETHRAVEPALSVFVGVPLGEVLEQIVRSLELTFDLQFRGADNRPIESCSQG